MDESRRPCDSLPLAGVEIRLRDRAGRHRHRAVVRVGRSRIDGTHEFLAGAAHDGRAVSEDQRLRRQFRQFLDRHVRLLHIGRVLRVRAGQTVPVQQAVAGQKQLALQQVVTDVSRRVSERLHDLDAAVNGQYIAITHDLLHLDWR